MESHPNLPLAYKSMVLDKKQVEKKDWAYKIPQSLDATHKLQGQGFIKDSSDGRIVAVLDRVAEPVGLAKLLFDDVKFTKGQRTQGLQSRSKTFGYMPRVKIMTAKQACRASQMASEFPEINEILMRWIREVGEPLYRKSVADQFGKHRDIVRAKVRPEYMASEVFTSGIINHTTQLPYHTDAGNFSGCWSLMLVLKSPQIGGGNLIIPEYSAELDLQNGSVVIFNGAELLHGVSRIYNPDPDNEYRFSIVFYSMEQLWQCKSPTEELANVRKMRTELESRPRSMENLKGKKS